MQHYSCTVVKNRYNVRAETPIASIMTMTTGSHCVHISQQEPTNNRCSCVQTQSILVVCHFKKLSIDVTRAFSFCIKVELVIAAVSAGNCNAHMPNTVRLRLSRSDDSGSFFYIHHVSINWTPELFWHNFTSTILMSVMLESAFNS